MSGPKTIESDVAILGGGISGAATAYHLSNLGHIVTLLERGAIASKASGVNAGLVGEIGWGHSSKLASHLALGSLEIFKKLQSDYDYDIEFCQSGSLTAIHTDEQYKYASERLLHVCSEGYSVELLTAREALILEPEINLNLKALVYSPGRGQADPKKTVQALAEIAQKNGTLILTYLDITGVFQLDDGTYRISTSDAEIHARVLVIAAGAWCAAIGNMLGLDIQIVPVRGQMWATGPLQPRMFHSITSVESQHFWATSTMAENLYPPMVTHVGAKRITRHLYGRQCANGEIIFGGDRENTGFVEVMDQKGIMVNKSHAAEVLPFLSNIPISRTWVGLMPFSPDKEPIIGKVPLRDNLYILTGLGSSGFGQGPMAGRLLSDLINGGEASPLLSRADPARCVREIG